MPNASAAIDVTTKYEQALVDLRKLKHDVNNKIQVLELNKSLCKQMQQEISELKKENEALKLALLRD